MNQTIDVSGLSPEAVRTVEALVGLLRNGGTTPTNSHWPGPPPDETPEQWVERFRAWCASRPRIGVIADDSREAIYDREGE